MLASTRLIWAAGAGGFVGLLAACGFGPVVEHQVKDIGARYGAHVSVGSTIPTLHGVRLRDVDVAIADLHGVTVHLDEVEVAYVGGRRELRVAGGLLSATGLRETLLQEVETWRTRYFGHTTEGARVGPRTAVDVAGVSFIWRNDIVTPTEIVAATQIGVSRDGDTVYLSAGAASAVVGHLSVEVKNGRLQLVRGAGGGLRVGSANADSVDAELVLSSAKQEAAPAAVANEPPKAPATGRARAALMKLALALNAAVEPGAKVSLSGVRLKVYRDSDSINLGPGRFQFARSADALLIDLAPELLGRETSPTAGWALPGTPTGGEEKEEAITFHLAVPLVADGGEVVADVSGGPIWLSSLGVKEGDFGLFDVAHTSVVTHSHVVLSADGETMRVTGDGKVHGLSIRSNALSDVPVAGLELAFRGKGEARVDGTHLSVEGGEVDLGAIRVLGEVDYERSEGSHRVRGSFELPLTGCQSMLDSIPKGLVPKLSGMRMEGSFGVKSKVHFDTARIDKDYAFDWVIANTCRISDAPPAVNVERFRQPFTRVAYEPSGSRVTIETGPGAPGWIPYSGISKFMEAALLTTEDAGFRRHHGFDQDAIRNSIRENLRKKRFVRGASTLSMQLAKNIYLERGKTVSRKLQEAILTSYLEQELTKEQILELYLNIVEFGPMVYGISAAARYYFNTTASDLTVSQAFYIASILPNPKLQHFDVSGVVAANWTNYLRNLMRISHRRRHLTDQELDEGLRETAVRGVPQPNIEERAAAPVRSTPGDPTVPEPPIDPSEPLNIP